MPYTPGIPTAVQFISASQPLIQQNFTEIQNAFSVDHFPLGSAAAIDGKHQWIHLPNSNPTPACAANEVVLYSGIGQFSGLNQLFFQPVPNAGGLNPNTLRAWTETLNQVQAVQDGYNYIGGGRICIRYNWVNPVNATDTYLWSGLGRPFGAPPIVICTVRDGGAHANDVTYSITTSNITVNGFDYAVRIIDGGAVDPIAFAFNFIAIGLAG